MAFLNAFLLIGCLVACARIAADIQRERHTQTKYRNPHQRQKELFLYKAHKIIMLQNFCAYDYSIRKLNSQPLLQNAMKQVSVTIGYKMY